MTPTPLPFRLAAVVLSFGLMGAYVWYRSAPAPERAPQTDTKSTIPVVTENAEPAAKRVITLPGSKGAPAGFQRFIGAGVELDVETEKPDVKKETRPAEVQTAAKKKRLVVLPGSKSAALIEIDDDEPLPTTEQEVFERVTESEEFKKQIERLRQDFAKPFTTIGEEEDEETPPVQPPKPQQAPVQRRVILSGSKSEVIREKP